MDFSDRFYLKTYCHISKTVAFVCQRTSCLISFRLVFLGYYSFRDHWNLVVHRAQSVQVWTTAIESTPTLQEQLSFSELVFFLCYHDIQDHLYESCFPLEKRCPSWWILHLISLQPVFGDLEDLLQSPSVCWIFPLKKVIWLADWLKLPMSKVRTCSFSGKDIAVSTKKKKRGDDL